jgi:hypothetical protein
MRKSVIGLLLMPFFSIIPKKGRLRNKHLLLLAWLAMSASACDGIVQPMCYDPAVPQDSIPNDTIPQDTNINESRIPATQNTQDQHEEQQNTSSSYQL